MRRRTLALPLGAVLLVGMVALGARADDASFTSTAGIGPLDGQQIYEHICQGCHMPGGQGAAGAGFYPKLSGDKKLSSWEYAAVTVLNGRNGMPAFGLPPNAVQQMRAVQLSDAQVALVINYVRTHFGNQWRPDVTGKQVSALPHPTMSASPF